MKRKFSGKYCLWSALAGVAVFFFAAYQSGLFTSNNAVKIFEMLSDAFVIPGVLIAGVGAISWTGYLGTYDMIGYGMKTLFFFLPQKEGQERPKTFYDYRHAKEEKGRTWFPEFLIVGLAFVVLAAVCLIVSMLI